MYRKNQLHPFESPTNDLKQGDIIKVEGSSTYEVVVYAVDKKYAYTIGKHLYDEYKDKPAPKGLDRSIASKLFLGRKGNEVKQVNFSYVTYTYTGNINDTPKAPTTASFIGRMKASMIIMSHLSDAQHLIGLMGKGSHDRMNNHINFAKSLLLKYKDTDTEIDADAEWEEFTKSRFYRPE